MSSSSRAHGLGGGSGDASSSGGRSLDVEGWDANWDVEGRVDGREADS